MRLSSATRIVVDKLRRRPKEQYWRAAAAVGRLRRAFAPTNRSFRRVFVQHHLDFVTGRSEPDRFDDRDRMNAAVDWLLQAQRATPDAGVSLGYFPCEARGDSAWLPSYPETTGYIIASLLEYADTFGRNDVVDRAREMTAWEIEVQLPSGGVQGGFIGATKRSPVAFNTGMVLQGYTAVLAAYPYDALWDAAERAATFLADDQAPDGHFRSHGDFVTGATIKTYNCLCGWALYRYAELTNSTRYRDAALRAAEAAVNEQRPNGWFGNNCLQRADAPITHTIGYTLQGVLEIGVLAGRADLVSAVKRGLEPVIERVDRSGFLHGAFYQDWEPACFSACVTGTTQLAIVAYRLFEILGERRYREIADRMVKFVKATQRMDGVDEPMRGAIPGSFPISGEYMTYGYPNWATKYFLDALIVRHRLAITENSGASGEDSSLAEQSRRTAIR